MKLLRYNVTPALAKLAAFAASRWNKALRCRVLAAEPSAVIADIMITFGTVDRSHDYERVAECRRRNDVIFIVLASDVTWSITFWQRVFGTGQEDALAALLHEFGHALGLPHSDRESDVMASTLGTTVISDDEAARYRRFLKL
jgi:hypothetical protein